VPLLGRLAPLGFSCTPGATSTVFRLDEPAGAAFSSLICFEDTVAPLARRSVLNGARLLVNQTNDAWFDGTAAAVQHMSHGVFRCIENRVPAVRCANTGVTCFIDPLGRVARLEQGADALYAQKSDQVVLPPRAMALTPYTRYGDLLLALPCAGLTGLVFVLAALAVKRESRRATMQTPAGAGAGEGTRV
jgi:apolipoprotein N-acyltransferase